MKRTLALILCLVLTAFAFASCGKREKPSATTAAATAAPTASTTAAASTEPATTAEPEETEPPHNHVPDDEYSVVTPATCLAPGSEAKYCLECGVPIESTIRPIPVDPNAHVVDAWTTVREATVIENGLKQGTCTVCKQPVDREIVDTSYMEWKYTTSSDKQQKKTKAVLSLLDDGEHYYSDPDAGIEGLDLIIEFSFLYNPTVHNLADMTASNGGRPILTGSMYDADIYWIPLKDNAAECTSPFAGAFERCDTLRTVEDGPAGMGDRTGLGTGTNYSDFMNIGGADQANPEYGWHRLAFFYHEELLNPAEVKAGEAAKYLVSSTAYLDGVAIYQISNRETADFDKSSDFTVNGLLFTAQSDGVGGITYTDSPNNKNATWIKVPVKCTSEGVAYVVTADHFVTAGTAVVQKVARVDSPAANTYTTEDGTVIDAPIWYRLDTDS